MYGLAYFLGDSGRQWCDFYTKTSGHSDSELCMYESHQAIEERSSDLSLGKERPSIGATSVVCENLQWNYLATFACEPKLQFILPIAQFNFFAL
jgi:hypothetical protein